MAYIKRVIILLLAVHWIELVTPKPLFTEINYKKTFEVFKHHGHHHPIRAHFFKEKSFGIKHKLLKRSSDNVPYSKFESLTIPVGEGEGEEDLSRLPAQEDEEELKGFASELVPVPVPAPPLPPAIVIITPPPPKVKPETILHTEVAGIESIPEIIKPVVEEIIEPVEKVPIIGEKFELLPLQGNGIEIEKLKEEVPPPPPPPTPPVEKVVESPVGRGSRLALFFGDLVLQVLSQFLANAHTTLSKFLENPPKF